MNIPASNRLSGINTGVKSNRSELEGWGDWEMILFKPIVAKGYEWINTVNKEEYEIFASFDGSSRIEGWKPIEVLRVRADKQQAFKASDFPWLGLALIMRLPAVDALHDILERFGEILPLATSDGIELFVYNVRAIDALDEDASDLIRFTGSNRIMMIKRAVFLSEKVEGVEVFRLPHRGSPIYVNEEFVRRVNDAGLKGLDFNQVWSVD